MTVYTYQAIDVRGRRVSGYRNISGQDSIKRYLEQKGYQECKIYASKTKIAPPYSLVTRRELAVFFRQMAALFNMEDDEKTAVAIMTPRTDNKQLKAALTEIADIATRGFSVFEAMGMYGHLFTDFAVGVIKGIEGKDNGVKAFVDLSERFAKEADQRALIRANVFYPVVTFASVAVVSLIILMKVFPMFRAAADSVGALSGNAAKSPSPSLSLNVAQTLNKGILITIASLLCVGILSYIFFRNAKNGQAVFDKILAKTPFLSRIVGDIASAQYLRSLVALVGRTESFADALEYARHSVGNKYLCEKLEIVSRRVNQGTALEKALEDLRPCPKSLGRTVYIAYVSGENKGLLSLAARDMEADADDALVRLDHIVEPILCAIMAVLLCAVLSSVIIPMVNVLGLL